MFYRLVSLSLLVLWTSLAYAGFDEGLSASRAGDKASAFLEFRAAAEAGDIRAFGKLGSMFLYGIGTEVDFVQAYAWFDLAAEAGDKYARRFHAAAANELTPAQREKAEGLAAELIKRYLSHPADTPK